MAEVANEVRDQRKTGAQAGVLERFFALLTLIAEARGFWMLAFAAAVVIGPTMMPVAWSANEIVYFDLAYRSVAPEAFTNHHAMFDGSNSRIVGMMAIGYVIKALGFEAAKTVLAVLCWGLYALALASVGRALGLRVIELLLALILFLLAGQELFGGEWIFGTIETKVLAYVCVLFGFAAALNGRWLIMVVATALATYFHFLVGGIGAAAFLLLLAMSRPGAAKVLRLPALYVLLIIPVLAILVSERVGVTVDLSALDRPADEIYAVIRVPHHAAPFSKGPGWFLSAWLPGLVMHGALAILLYWGATGTSGRERTLLFWGAILNLLLIFAMGLSFLDRDTHHLAKFLIFRPSAIVLLVSCLLLCRLHMQKAGFHASGYGGPALLLVAALLLPQYLLGVAKMLVQLPPETRLYSQMREPEQDVVRWIAENTPPDAAILLESSRSGLDNDGDPFTLGAERLTGRGMIVDFKTVPSGLADFVRWYTLLKARAAFFAGDCAQLAVLEADYVVFRNDDSPKLLSACNYPVYDNAAFTVARTREAQ
jgi:hypothetical protein